MKGLLERFIPEARDLIDSSSSGLLRLEKAPDDGEAVNEVFRAVHTLKGSSGLFDVPALTRLVHAAEDLLGAVRSGDLDINSDHVDQLLSALDQVSVWIDHLEDDAHLPEDADRISANMAGALRKTFEAMLAPAGQPPEAVKRGQARHEDLAAFTADELFDAFLRQVGGMPVAHIRYRPAEDCFFNGTDPLSLSLSTPGLLSVAIASREPLAPLASLDPYRALLTYDILAAAPVDAVDQHFAYELDHAVVSAISTADLVHIEGRPSESPVFSDFHSDGLKLLKAGDLAAVSARARMLADTMGAELASTSALRHLIAALATAAPDLQLIGRLIDAVETGQLGTLSESIDATVSVPAAEASQALAVMASEAETARALDIIETQLRRMKGRAYDQRWAVGVRSIVGNMALALGIPDIGEQIGQAWDDCEAAQSYAPMTAALEVVAARLAGGAVAPSQEASPTSVAPVDAPHETALAEITDTAIERTVDHEAKRTSRTLKVDQTKIDELMNLIGELAVSKNSLPFLAKRAEDVFGSRELAREIKEQYAVIDRLAQDLQGAIMQVRMLPISDVFDRFPRLVRDLSRKLGKEIDLVIEGGDTAADKNIIEALNDPLLHIVRNSLDHGVEAPDVRIAAGKSARATITLAAFQEADHVVIEVSDDGRGIDPVKIRASAVSKGVIDQAEADRLTDQEAVNLIFRPGFSTAEKVSDLSGRGVGMDVVRTVVEKLGGHVSVTSRVGEGSITQLMLPLSMAVTRIMIIEAASGQYGVPMDLIVETVRVEPERIHKIQHAEAFILRDQLIPLVRMANLLNQPAQPLVHGAEAVLVCRVAGRVVGLIIDDFKVGMDVIVKPLEGIVANMRGFSGTTLLGDGRVLLVLDLKELV